MKKRVVLIAAALLWMGVIFLFSSQNADVSGETSGRLVALLERIFFPRWAALPEEEHLMQTFALTLLVRKMAHFTEYVILGILLSEVAQTFEIQWKFRVLLPFLAGSLYAVSDEFHQSFVDGRAMEAFDMLVDSAGVFVGVMLGCGIGAMVMLGKMRNS